MALPTQPERIAILWQLAWTDDSVLACCVYRDAHGLQLRVESKASVVMSERFELHPRAVARAQTLRDSLKRRGWQEAPALPPPAGPPQAGGT